MTKKQVFIKGALILGIANVVVKLIGALYIIPLARLIGANGMGLYSSAYQIYLWLFIVSTTGLPIAISKMVSEEIEIGRPKEAHRIFRISLGLLIAIGITSTLILYFSAGLLVSVIGTSKAYHCLIAISPCLLFVSVMSAYRGYFQGMQNMIPTAVSELFEALVKAVMGIFLAYMLLDKGIEYSSAGAVFGVSLGGLIGMVLLFIIYRFYRPKIFDNIKKTSSSRIQLQRKRTIIKKLVQIALPITLGASVYTVSSIIDLTMIMRRLQEIGFAEDYAVKLYGYLTGYAYKIYSLSTTVVIALAISIVPAIAANYVSKNLKSIVKIADTGLRIALMFSIPAAAGVAVLSGPILKLLFNDSNASQILRALSLAIIFVSTVQVSGAILQGIGKVIIPVKNLLIGAVVKIVTNYILIGIPTINILGAPIATAVCYFIVTVLNFIQIKKFIQIKFNYIDLFIKPIAASVMMSVVVLYSYDYFLLVWHRNSISTLLSVFIGIISYIIFILVLGGVKKSDLEMLPYGQKLAQNLFKLKIIR